MYGLLIYVFCIVAFLLLSFSLFYFIQKMHFTLPKPATIHNANSDMLYTYLPTTIQPCHTIDNKIHPVYGKQVETICSNKKALSIKALFILFITLLFYIVSIQKNIVIDTMVLYILYAIFLGYSIYYLLQIPSTVILYKTGLSYKHFFYTKNIPYTTIGNISFISNKYSFLPLHSTIIITLTTGGKPLYLREQHFSYIKDKIMDLQNSLCWSEIFTYTINKY